MATHGALAATAAKVLEKSQSLTRALNSKREIGVAMDALMNRHSLSRFEAFNLLRVASQHLNRKLFDIAVEIGDGHPL
jgi:AmiR/NasT family two-component response regulator